MDENNKTTPR